MRVEQAPQKCLTRTVTATLVVRIHEPAALVDPGPKSVRFSRPLIPKDVNEPILQLAGAYRVLDSPVTPVEDIGNFRGRGHQILRHVKFPACTEIYTRRANAAATTTSKVAPVRPNRLRAI
jgi:hypothetical protein